MQVFSRWMLLAFVGLLACPGKQKTTVTKNSTSPSSGDSAGSLLGSWEGFALIVPVEYTFRDDTYEQRTYSSNSIPVMIARGHYSVDALAHTIALEQEQLYTTETGSSKGTWAATPKHEVAKFAFSGDKLTITKARVPMELTRKKP